MELLIIIIQEQDYPGLSKAFIRSKIRDENCHRGAVSEQEEYYSFHVH